MKHVLREGGGSRRQRVGNGKGRKEGGGTRGEGGDKGREETPRGGEKPGAGSKSCVLGEGEGVGRLKLRWKSEE